MSHSAVRRQGSPFTGFGPVFLKELADHLSSVRMIALMLFVVAFGAFPVASSLQTLRTVVDPNSFLFLRIFTLEPRAGGHLLRRGIELHHPADGDRTGLRFGEQRVQAAHAQSYPVAAHLSRRAVDGQVPGGAGDLRRGARGAVVDGVSAPACLCSACRARGVEVGRGVGFLVVAIAYGGIWLAISMLFSVLFRSSATSALCALGLWLFFFLLWPQLASAIVSGVAPGEIRSVEDYAARQDLAMGLMRLSPGTLFSEAVLALLSPETRTLGPMLPVQMRGAILGAAAALRPEPALDLAADHRSDRWHDRGPRRRLRLLPARGSPRVKDWTVAAARNNARWCDAVCRAYGHPGRILPHMWVNAAVVPRFYPNAVTLAVGDTAVEEQFTTVEILHKSEPARPLVGEGQFRNARPLASWVRAAVRGDSGSAASCRPKHRRPISSGRGRRKARGCLLAIRTSQCSRARRGFKVVAGFMLYRAAEVVGVSNVVAEAADAPAVWRSLTLLAAQTFPHLPLVGYESGDELQAAVTSGFEAGDMLRGVGDGAGLKPQALSAASMCPGGARRDDDRRFCSSTAAARFPCDCRWSWPSGRARP